VLTEVPFVVSPAGLERVAIDDHREIPEPHRPTATRTSIRCRVTTEPVVPSV
jgi:hypothetical protein